MRDELSSVFRALAECGRGLALLQRFRHLALQSAGARCERSLCTSVVVCHLVFCAPVVKFSTQWKQPCLLSYVRVDTPERVPIEEEVRPEHTIRTISELLLVCRVRVPSTTPCSATA